MTPTRVAITSTRIFDLFDREDTHHEDNKEHAGQLAISSSATAALCSVVRMLCEQEKRGREQENDGIDQSGVWCATTNLGRDLSHLSYSFTQTGRGGFRTMSLSIYAVFSNYQNIGKTRNRLLLKHATQLLHINCMCKEYSS